MVLRIADCVKRAYLLLDATALQATKNRAIARFGSVDVTCSLVNSSSANHFLTSSCTFSGFTLYCKKFVGTRVKLPNTCFSRALRRLQAMLGCTTAMSTDSHNPGVRRARQRPRAATEQKETFGFPRAGIVEVDQKTGPSVSSFPRVVAWSGSTVWETARTCV